jgi:hypothetical protein
MSGANFPTSNNAWRSVIRKPGADPERNLMAKANDQRKVEPQPNQRLPKDHFDSDGKSQGPQTGAVRKTRDAYNTERKESK